MFLDNPPTVQQLIIIGSVMMITSLIFGLWMAGYI